LNKSLTGMVLFLIMVYSIPINRDKYRPIKKSIITDETNMTKSVNFDKQAVDIILAWSSM